VPCLAPANTISFNSIFLLPYSAGIKIETTRPAVSRRQGTNGSSMNNATNRSRIKTIMTKHSRDEALLKSYTAAVSFPK
jgi:hypothetical protein